MCILRCTNVFSLDAPQLDQPIVGRGVETSIISGTLTCIVMAAAEKLGPYNNIIGQYYIPLLFFYFKSMPSSTLPNDKKQIVTDSPTTTVLVLHPRGFAKFWRASQNKLPPWYGQVIIVKFQDSTKGHPGQTRGDFFATDEGTRFVPLDGTWYL